MRFFDDEYRIKKEKDGKEGLYVQPAFGSERRVGDLNDSPFLVEPTGGKYNLEHKVETEAPNYTTKERNAVIAGVPGTFEHDYVRHHDRFVPRTQSSPGSGGGGLENRVPSCDLGPLPSGIIGKGNISEVGLVTQTTHLNIEGKKTPLAILWEI